MHLLLQTDYLPGHLRPGLIEAPASGATEPACLSTTKSDRPCSPHARGRTDYLVGLFEAATLHRSLKVTDTDDLNKLISFEVLNGPEPEVVEGI